MEYVFARNNISGRIIFFFMLFSAVIANAQSNPLGQPWENSNVSLNLIRIDIRASNGQDAAVQAWFSFINASGQRILVDINYDTIYLIDSFGTRYIDWEGGTNTVWVEPGERYAFSRYYSTSRKTRSRIPSQSRFIQVIVNRFSRIENVSWYYMINPDLTIIPHPASGTFYYVGQPIRATDISINLTNIDVRASAGEAAAVRAWFTVMNHSNTRKLVEIDFSHLYITDAFNRQFIDWEGGGVVSVWIEPGQGYNFNRYYSEMSQVGSRITSGSRYILINVKKMLGINNSQWCYDIMY